MEEEPDYLPPGPQAEPREAEALDDWRKAEAGHAARLARVAGRIGALDERLKRGPDGWRHRLALIEAADLSWFAGDRIGLDRLTLWISMRMSGLQDDTAALARVGWTVRRLTGGPARRWTCLPSSIAATPRTWQMKLSPSRTAREVGST